MQLLLQHMPLDALNKWVFSFDTTSYAPISEEAINLLMLKQPDHQLAVKIFGKEFLDYSSIQLIY